MESATKATSFLGKLLHLADPMLPIGGYTHSNGQETYVQMEIVKDARTAASYAENMLRYNIKYNDAAFVRFAYQRAQVGDLAGLLNLDQECTALKGPREIREASLKLGLRLSKVFNKKFSTELLDNYLGKIRDAEGEGNYCIMFGLLACIMEIPLAETLLAFYYNVSIGMITTSVKLVPLGQQQGQDIMLELQPLLYELVRETMDLPEELRGLCSIGFDIRCMQHERLYSRLYMS